MASFAFDNPDSALIALAERLQTVKQTHQGDEFFGQVVASPILADRGSPAADVSAMDGYAIRMEDLNAPAALPIGGESKAGSPPPTLEPGTAVRISPVRLFPKDVKPLSNAKIPRNPKPKFGCWTSRERQRHPGFTSVGPARMLRPTVKSFRLGQR